jgi:soluble lytic murein transglycosylase-like protein
MQAILTSAFPYFFPTPVVKESRQFSIEAPSPSRVALVAALLLLLAAAPEAGMVPGTEILPLDDAQGDLNLSEVVARIAMHLPAEQKPQAYRLGRLVLELSERHQFSPSLILAVVEMESSYRFTVVSKAGAVGLMQLLPATAQEVATRYHIRSYRSSEDLRDPAVNMRLGVAYLAQLRRQFGQSLHYIAAYNVGPYALQKRLRDGHYDLGSLEPYVRSIHDRTRLLRAGRTTTKLRSLRREEALLAASL